MLDRGIGVLFQILSNPAKYLGLQLATEGCELGGHGKGCRKEGRGRPSELLWIGERIGSRKEGGEQDQGSRRALKDQVYVYMCACVDFFVFFFERL